MSQKWTHATVECFQVNSYTLDGFYVRRGQTITIEDEKLADQLRRVKELSVVDFYKEEPDKIEQSKSKKKGK